MNLPVSSGDLGIFFVKLLTKLVNLTKLDLNGVEDVKAYERYQFFTKIVYFSYRIVLYGPLWRVRNKSCMSRGRYQEGQVKGDKSRVTSQRVTE